MIKSLKSLALQLNDCQYVGQDVAITGAHINSKEISQGQLFVALQGERDGHDFIEHSIQNGAVAALVTQQQADLNVPQIIVKDTRKALFDLALLYRKTLNLPVLSITGSCGKTTTKEILVSMLKAFGKVHYSHGNFNNDLGVPMTVLSTPQDVDFVVIEAGTNAPGEIPHLTQLIKPDYAGITNVSASHLEKLKSLDGVMIEKGALLQGIQPQGKAIINLDDPRINAFAKALAVDQVTFSMNNTAADIYLYAQQESITALSFTVSVAKKRYEARLNVIGQHNIQNTLTALSFIYALQLDIQSSLNALANYQPYKGRFSLVTLNDYVTLIDDTYNASVQSVKAAINDLATFKGDKYLVLSNMGELGEHAEHYHQEVGRLIKQSSIDYVYLYGNKAWMTLLAQEAGGYARYFEHKNALIEALRNDLNNNQNILSRILVKGSRANQMEDVVGALKKYYKEAAL
ncbi:MULTISPECIES: UDP-N-acetylmuramoyl-tripeptide--D-alanyl-D-alanine ligase [Cysteiniphilum]|uniref:UDP-N-acetylmuramoyl-tripeptide--D-alanyl-D-alanine ligase n=1 Tax=Cysteiniphilum litorale TaxID=2056700 RepID=A0A8J3E8R8_9GAMM|nr:MULTISPECIES: UDP-N-acetylmuramoyl-tripeptide--D-alanyl-D-alanine ligase [Cysteiniphilum]GGF97595.1 UDP-N-acetylmuramoyl-tripeptide--D-alanyl-D-alanine ligase [Cysteiniphilum litorale]